MKKLTKLIALIAALLVLPISPVRAAETRTIDIVAITWPGAPAPTVSVNDVKSAIENEVTTRWNYLAQNWPGGINFSVGTVQSTPIQMTIPLVCEGGESSIYMRDARRAFYKDGSTVVFKVTDGAERAHQVILQNAFSNMGINFEVKHPEVFGGGKVIGEIRAAK